MSVLLINPPYTEKVYGTKQAPSVQPPIGLGYLAAILEKKGIEVKILDANAEFLKPEEAVEKILSSSAKYIGFTSVTTTIPLIYRLSSLIKEKDCTKIIIVGGPHVSFTAEQTLKDCPAIDIVVRGEGELTLCELINFLKEKKDISRINGISFRKNGALINTPERELIEDIDKIPFPARHLLPIHLYSPSPLSNVGFKGKKYARIITTRGCPNQCIFCSSAHFWKIVRLRSAENVMEEIELLIKKYGVRHIDFLDDTLTLSPERLTKICKTIIDKNLNIKWSCYSRVNTITPELVNLMKKAGCKVIQFGVESGNQEILNSIKKGITLEAVRRAAKIVRKANIKLMCDFMIGLPGDTKETVNQTIDFAIEIKPNIAAFCITTPFPGTALYNEYRNLGLLKDGYIWGKMNLHEKTEFFTPTLSSSDLQQLYFRAYRRFYYRPAYVLQTIRWLIKNPYEIKNFYFLGKTLIIRQLRNILKRK